MKALIRVYQQSLLLPNPGAVDYGRDVVSHGSGGHGKHGIRTVHHSFGQDAPASVRMERALAAVAAYWRREVEAELKGPKPKPTRADLRRAILGQEGVPPVYVAAALGVESEDVRRERSAAGLDPETGERVRRAVPITAPAHTQAQGLQHERIRRARERLALTQAQVAEVVGVTDRTVHRWEKGRTRPNAEQIATLADALGVRPGDLLPAGGAPPA